MRKRNWFSVSLLMLGVGTASANGFSQSVAPTSSPDHSVAASATAGGTLKITFGDKSESWTPATLAALPHTTISVFDEHAKAQQSYSGVLLEVLVARLGVPEKPHGKDFRLYLLAEGSDGYGVVYSVGEVTPDVHDGTVIVADAMAGKPLGESGPLQLVASGEKRPARWVRNLVAIHVMAAQ